MAINYTKKLAAQDFTLSPIRNFLLENLSADPSRVEGQVFYNSNTHLLKYSDDASIKTILNSSNVDNSTIEINSGSLRVKDGGITTAKLASTVFSSRTYSTSFNATTDWGSLNGDNQYVITISAATHGFSTSGLIVDVWAVSGSTEVWATDLLYIEHNTSSGDVLLYVDSTGRFACNVYITKRA